jgi:hypothetical protein
VSQKRYTEYVCDHCGKSQERKRDLRRFGVHDSPWKNQVSFDVCDACESLFLGVLAPYLPEGEDVAVMRRV